MEIQLFPFDVSKQKPFLQEDQEHIKKILLSTNQKIFQNIVIAVTNKIDCTQCANCCKKLVPGFSDEDIARVSVHLKMSRKEFIHTYLCKRDKQEYEMKQAPCLFLKENKCSIYDVRPAVCRTYPQVSTLANSYVVASNAKLCPIVFNVIENLQNK